MPMISNNNNTRVHRDKLRIMSWNINGVTGKRDYIRLLMEKHDPDILFLCETKRILVISQHSELACDDTYRVVQIKSTSTNGGGMIAIIRNNLQLVTTEVMRKNDKNDFAQAILLLDKEEKAYVGWYNSPMMGREAFKTALTRLHKVYNIQSITGDLNARHPRWCRSHDNARRGTQLLHFIRTFPDCAIYAPSKPTFEEIACREVNTKITSTVDLVLSKQVISKLQRVEGYIASCSDHYPISFQVDARVETNTRPRRTSKTLLQSAQLR